MTSTKSNGDPLEGTTTPPLNYPDPADHNVNMHPIDWAYGVGNKLIDFTAPTAPTNLQSTAHTTKTITLSWTASGDTGSGVAAYDVYNGSDLASSVSGLTATVTGLTADTEYTFTVKARDVLGNASADSDPVTVTTAADTTPPTAPTDLACTGHTDTTVTLTWTASTDVDTSVVGYDVYEGETLATSVTDTTATVTDLTTATEYTFTVTARDAADNVSDASDPVTVTTS